MLNDTIGRNTEPGNWHVRTINAPSDKYKLSDSIGYSVQSWLFLSTLVWDQNARGGSNAGRGSKVAVGAFSCLWFKRKMCSILLLVKNNNKKLFTTGSCLLRNYIWSKSFVCVCRGGLCLCMSKFECIQVIYQSWQQKKTKFEHRNLASPGKRRLPSNLLHMKGCRSCVPLRILDCSHLTDELSGSGNFQDILKFSKHWPCDHEALASVIIIVMSNDKLPGLTYQCTVRSQARIK